VQPDNAASHREGYPCVVSTVIFSNSLSSGHPLAAKAALIFVLYGTAKAAFLAGLKNLHGV
jgi:hypothetical protein